MIKIIQIIQNLTVYVKKHEKFEILVRNFKKGIKKCDAFANKFNKSAEIEKKICLCLKKMHWLFLSKFLVKGLAIELERVQMGEFH